jgi:Kinesin motor domain
LSAPGVAWLQVISKGTKSRRVGSHELNLESSRSHSILTVYCDVTVTDPGDYDAGGIRHGKISFVDLAGSERLKDTKSTGGMLRETTNINRSLFALGKVCD